MSIYEYFGTGINTNVPMFGTEYEVENVGDHGKAGNIFNIHTDGSLRNNGYEYTTPPLSFEDSLEAFKSLFQTLDYNKKLGHSERTSTHVHVNVGSLSIEQCKQFILVYAALEPLFFNYVAPNRKDNIFCVPLSYTTLSKNYNKDLTYQIENWHKYTAFNILPIREFGTVEFRHLQGTCDFNLYEGWLTSLKQLFTYIKANPEFDLLAYLNKGNSIEQLADIVPILKEKASGMSLTTLLYDTTLDVKLSCGGVIV